VRQQRRAVAAAAGQTNRKTYVSIATPLSSLPSRFKEEEEEEEEHALHVVR